MARMRTIKPEFWSSPQVVDCSRDARLLFIGLWNFCDDAGVIPLNLRAIKMRIFPGDDLDSTSIRRYIDELSSSDLLHLYEFEGQEYVQVTGWHHQKIDRPTFRYPTPKNRRSIAERSTTPRRVLDDHSPPERREGEEGVPDSTTDRRPIDDHSTKRKKSYSFEGKVIRLTESDFETWSKAYPNIPDLKSELQAIDDWCEANLEPDDKNKWFHRVSRMLNSKNQRYAAERAEKPADGDQDFRRYRPTPEHDEATQRRRDELLGVSETRSREGS